MMEPEDRDNYDPGRNCEQCADLFLFLGVKACLFVRTTVNKGGTDYPFLFSPSFWVHFIKLEISTTAGSFVLFLHLIRSENLLTRAVPHVKPISAMRNNLKCFKRFVLTQLFIRRTLDMAPGQNRGSGSEQTRQDNITNITTAHSEWNKQVSVCGTHNQVHRVPPSGYQSHVNTITFLPENLLQ